MSKRMSAIQSVQTEGSSLAGRHMHHGEVHRLPAVPKAGRFRERPGLKVVRRLFGGLSDHLPTLAVLAGYHLISTPPRFRLPDWQRALVDSAKKREVPFARSHLMMYEWGQGPRSVLLVNGWGSHATHMGKMIAPLTTAGYRVIAFDPPAHGQSGGRSTDLVQFAAAVDRIARAAGGVDHIVAHSFGSAMALYARRDWGTPCRSQVLISPFHDCLWFLGAFGRYVGLKPHILARMRERMSERHGGRVDWERLSIPDMLRETRGSTLLIHDHEDAEVPVSHSLAIREAVEDTELKLTRGFGHHRILGSAEVMESVLEFLARTSSSPPANAAEFSARDFDSESGIC